MPQNIFVEGLVQRSDGAGFARSSLRNLIIAGAHVNETWPPADGLKVNSG